MCEKLECMSTHFDGSHWGLTDWYPEIEKGIHNALRRGKKAEWTTGWYGSKKEIASASITHRNGEILVEASVSDDFDTEGYASRTIPHTTSLAKLRKAIDEVWDEAAENQKGNRQYYGFSILHKRKMYSTYIGSKPQGRGRMVECWVETFLLPRTPNWDVYGIGFLDTPPGDNYHKWGWQEECDVPARVKRKLEEWARAYTWGETEEQSFKYQGWTIKPWED